MNRISELITIILIGVMYFTVIMLYRKYVNSLDNGKEKKKKKD